MTPLHLVFSTAGLQSCLESKGSTDRVVLLGEAVFSDRAEFSALQEDCQLRGVPAQSHHISMAQLVDLCVSHSPVVSWSI